MERHVEEGEKQNKRESAEMLCLVNIMLVASTVVSHERPVSHARNTAYLALSSFQHCEYFFSLCRSFISAFLSQCCRSVNMISAWPSVLASCGDRSFILIANKRVISHLKF